MISRSLVVQLFLVSSLVACGGASPPPSAPAPTKPAADPHGIEADEVLVTLAPVPDQWTAPVDAWVAKQEKPADEKGEAIFYVVQGNGHEVRSKTSYKSHPAAKDELKPGVMAGCFADAQKEGIWHAPANAQASRNGKWVLAHVTDVAEVEGGIVRVANARCALDAVRIVTPAK